MPAPKGVRVQAFKLASGGQVQVYSSRERVVLQLRRTVPTPDDVLEPSFKVAVALNAQEIMALTRELLVAARLTSPAAAERHHGEIMAVAGELLTAAARLTGEPGQGDGSGRLDDRTLSRGAALDVGGRSGKSLAGRPIASGWRAASVGSWLHPRREYSTMGIEAP